VEYKLPWMLLDMQKKFGIAIAQNLA